MLRLIKILTILLPASSLLSPPAARAQTSPSREPGNGAAQVTGPVASDQYSPDRLKQIQTTTTSSRDGRVTPPMSPEEVITRVISMRNAIDITDKIRPATGLTADQRSLVEIVAEERKERDGRVWTDQTADEDFFLLAVTDRILPPGGASERPVERLIQVNFRDAGGSHIPAKQMHSTLDHELWHFEQQFENHTVELIPNASSFDKGLTYLGMEGQANIVQQEYQRAREGQPPLSDQEKRALFVHNVTSDPVYCSWLAGASRRDGERISIDMFAKAYGTTPLHPGTNFLEGYYKDPADVFDVNATLHNYRIAAESKIAAYTDFPPPSASLERFESDDRRHIVLVLHDADKVGVRFFQLWPAADGPSYALMQAQGGMLTGNARNNAAETLEFDITRVRDQNPASIRILVNLGTKDAPLTTVKGTVNGNTPFGFHRATEH
jgi:hypothetical protein